MRGVRCFVSVGECQGLGVSSSRPVLTATTTLDPRAASAVETMCGVVEHRPVPWWKRPLDLFLLFLFLPALGLIFGLIALLIKVVSPGPVFFVQERIGHGGKPFRLLKFRTMRADNDGKRASAAFERLDQIGPAHEKARHGRGLQDHPVRQGDAVIRLG